MTTNNKIEIQTLATSLDPMIDHYNAHQDKIRFMAVLSPMCPK